MAAGEWGGRRKEEGGRRKKEEGGRRRKEEGGRRKEGKRQKTCVGADVDEQGEC
jgi:hypothetical protein